MKIKDLISNRWFKMSLFVVLGAIGGYSYYYFIGCYNGHCLISSNPYISTGYGMAAGLVMGWDNKKSKNQKNP